MAALVAPAPALPPGLALSSRAWEASDTIYCHEGWKVVDVLTTNLVNCIERRPGADFSSISMYSMYLQKVVSDMVWQKLKQKPDDHYRLQLYDGFGEKLNEYLESVVLASLTNKEFTLEELAERCSKYKVMAHWFAKGFADLRYFIDRKRLDPLNSVAIIRFQELIYKEIKGKIKYALTATIKHQEGKIDTSLKEVLHTFDQIKLFDSDIEDDFEYILLKVTKKYCEESQKWKSYTDYITKAEEYYLRNEPNLIGDQLLQSSFKEIQYLLFTQKYPKQVLEEELFTLLRDGKAEDLSKTYRFFESRDKLKEIDKVFRKLKDRFSKHLLDKIVNLHNQAKYSTSNKKVQMVLLWEFIRLHDIEYFNGLTKTFFKALKKSVSCSLSAQFFDIIGKNIWEDQSGMLRKEDKEIYQEVTGKVKDKLIPLIRKQRKQEKIIEEGKVMLPLLRKVLDMLYHRKSDCFMGDIVNPLIKSTKDDYSEKASSFISENLCVDDYMKKVIESMELEKNLCCLYSPFGNINDMMDQEVINVLFGSYSDSLLHDYQAEDLSRMYILLSSKICGLVDQNTFVERVNKNKSKYNNQDAESNEKVSTLLLYISDKQYHIANILREKLGARLQETLPHDEDISRMVKPFPETKSHLKLFIGMFKMLITKEIIELVKPTEHSTINMEAIEDAFRLAFDDGDLATLVPEILADAVYDIILKKADTDEASCEKEARRDEAIKMVSRLLVYMSNQYVRVHFANICWAKLEAGLQKSFADLSNEELSEMYGLFSKFNSGQEPFVGMFKANLRKKIMKMVKQQAEDSASDKESFARKVIDLHYQYKQQAKICFQDHESFRKAIEDAFRLALATLDVEMLADAVCDTILKKADMVSGLLVCISARDRFDNICRVKLLGRLKESFADLHEKVKQAKDSASYKKDLLVWKIIGLHDKFVKRVTGFFGGHTTVCRALDKVFVEEFCKIDDSGTLTAQLLANFCDNILKKDSSKTLSDDEITSKEKKLDKVVTLLAYINNRDRFAKFCWNNLANRLRFKRSYYELERRFLTKLQKYVLFTYCQKMDTMIAEITRQTELVPMFNNPGIHLDVTVLHQGSWPSYETLDIKFPDEMVNCLRPHEEYHQKNGKKLSWIFGNCTVEATFGTKNYDLIVNEIQAAVLYLFNESDDILTCSEIAKKLETTVDAIKPWLQSLSCGEYKILKLNKKGDTGTISSDDEFTFNPDFEDKKKTIKIPLPPDVRIMKKRKAEDMGPAIEAAIVRITKQRKVISHKELVSECVRQLKFKPDDGKVIKKRIESLIIEEYIERDKADRNTYRYIATRPET